MPNQAPDISQLKDIHLPNAINDWPISFGWWWLLTVIIMAIFIGCYAWYKEWKKSATKRAALTLLNHQYEHFKENGNAQVFLQQSNQILKRFCLEKHPQAVSLSGPAWTNFLIRQSHKTFFDAELANAISQGIYQPHCQFDAQALHQACSSWLKHNKPTVLRKKMSEQDLRDKFSVKPAAVNTKISKQNIGNVGSSND
ncbi:hypothetical protein A9R00_04515 [Oleispira antarctica]|uniref:DUF4381 domain-containing protein n=1 Tax=Oleispira antarctica TaxID=188908 RepID=A0A1Y5HXT9_OLEAN|nr:hypothetical protein A9R00_04515 [Oleispira antarctica]